MSSGIWATSAPIVEVPADVLKLHQRNQQGGRR
jgi:hypothetical protein